MWTSPAAANGSGFGYQTFPSGVHERRQPRAVWPVGRRAAVREQPPQRRRAADARGGPKQRRLQMRRRRANSLPQKVGLGAWGASALGFEHRANCHARQTERSQTAANWRSTVAPASHDWGEWGTCTHTRAVTSRCAPNPPLGCQASPPARPQERAGEAAELPRRPRVSPPARKVGALNPVTP